MENDNIPAQDIPIILVVDDVVENLKLLGNILTNEGFKVGLVTSGSQALIVAAKELPSLILLDIMMPEMDGFEVCCRLKENVILKDIPVIFISALNETKSIVKALNSGGADYVNKPFQSEEVIARVNTQLKLRRQSIELQKLLAAKDKFFAIIAHDLRSPLGGMMTLAKLLLERSGSISNDLRNEVILNLHDSLKNTYDLLINLFDWSNMDRGLAEFNPKILRLTDAVTECKKTVSEFAHEKDILIITDINEDQEVFVDSNMLQIVIRNLLSNSIKFTNRGGSITISSCFDRNNMTRVSVKDTGIGMNDEIRNNLFRIGENIKRSGTAGELSTGLGLLLCKEFVEKLKGKIWVESEEGIGTVFHFTIPSRSNPAHSL